MSLALTLNHLAVGGRVGEMRAFPFKGRCDILTSNLPQVMDLQSKAHTPPLHALHQSPQHVCTVCVYPALDLNDHCHFIACFLETLGPGGKVNVTQKSCPCVSPCEMMMNANGLV